MMLATLPILVLVLLFIGSAHSFQLNNPYSSPVQSAACRDRLVALHENMDSTESMGNVDEYRNGVTQFLSNFMQKEKKEQADPLADIDFNAPKVAKMSLERLASALDRELYEKEWFVTGRVNPVYFDNGFQFQDPDVKLTGIEGKHNNSCVISPI
jgi:hypothetical protein